MTAQWPILLCTADQSLIEEVENALSRLLSIEPVIYSAEGLLRSVELCRVRQPKLVLVEIDEDFEKLKSLLTELRAVSPLSSYIGVYREDRISQEVWEKTSQGRVFVEGIRLGLSDFLRRPVAAGDLEQLVDRMIRSTSIESPQLGSVVAFVSNKGGVGKSTLAVNVATRLALQHPEQVLLIDCSLQMGVCSSMLDLQPRTTLLDVEREKSRLDETLLRKMTTRHFSGLDLLAAPPDAISAIELHDETISQALSIARRMYRFVIVDTFPLFDRTVISLLDIGDLAYIVLENVVPTIVSAVRLVELMNGLGYTSDRRRIVVNRFSRSAGNPGLASISASLNESVDHVLPFDRRAVYSANTGSPFALRRSRFSGLERGLRGIVEEIESIRPGQLPERQLKQQSAGQARTAVAEGAVTAVLPGKSVAGTKNQD